MRHLKCLNRHTLMGKIKENGREKYHTKLTRSDYDFREKPKNNDDDKGATKRDHKSQESNGISAH